LRIRAYPGEGLELAPEALTLQRLSVWPGNAPPICPGREALSAIAGEGWMNTERVWLETRPAGVLLSDQLSLSGTEIAILLEEVLEALLVLESVGLQHGSICAERIVVSDEGRPVLIGRGRGDASDLEGAQALLTQLWPSGEAPLLDHQPKDLSGFWSEVKALIGSQASEPVHAGIARRVQAMRQGIPSSVEQVYIQLLDQEERLDEVSIDLGPEPGARGIFGAWNTNTGGTGSTGLTGLSDSSREWTMADAGPAVDAHQSLLAQALSLEKCEFDPFRFRGKEAEVAAVIRRELANEPLEPLAFGVKAATPPLEVEALSSSPPQESLGHRRVILMLVLLGAVLAYFFRR